MGKQTAATPNVADIIHDARVEFAWDRGLDSFLVGWLSSFAGIEETTKAIAGYRASRTTGAKS